MGSKKILIGIGILTVIAIVAIILLSGCVEEKPIPCSEIINTTNVSCEIDSNCKRASAWNCINKKVNCQIKLNDELSDTYPAGNCECINGKCEFVLLSEALGVWKPDYQEINKTIENIRDDLKERHQYKIEYVGGSKFNKSVITIGRTIYNKPTSFGKNITMDKAKEIAIDFLKQKGFIFNGETIDITRAEYINRGEYESSYYIIEFRRNYKNISLYSPASDEITLYPDGRIKDAGLQIFKNISITTKPKITEDQIKDIISKKFNVPKEKCECTADLFIYPKYYSGEQYWSYHLIRQCLNRQNNNIVIIDVITGDIILMEKPIE